MTTLHASHVVQRGARELYRRRVLWPMQSFMRP
jgi:hypothetical protein